MLLLIGFAFIAGIVTILSPCILPILPIVLSGSLTGDKKRPLGIITGFILSFTFFTLFLTTIVKLTGLPSDVLRNAAVIIIGIFGISLLIPQAQVLMEKFVSKLSTLSSNQNNRSGFSGGIVIGLSLGLVWAPCVGPILASVITLAATSQVTFGTFFITLAYSLGSAIPMLGIMYGGRNLLNKFPNLTKSGGTIQKVFGILMIATAFIIFNNIDRKFQAYVLEKFPQYGTGLTKIEENNSIKKQLDNLKNVKIDLNSLVNSPAPNPTFKGYTKWVNSEPLTLAKLKGKVVLVDFWTYTCINCVRTLPYVTSWYEKYKDQGLIVIGVHTPEFEFEKKESNVLQAMKDYKITYPVVQDNDYNIWNSYHNQYWPAHYLIDAQGNLRDTHFGEGGYEETEKKIQSLLKEAGAQVKTGIVSIKDQTPTGQMTPETYLGLSRLERATNSVTNVGEQALTLSNDIPQNYISYGGTWNIKLDNAESIKDSILSINFNADQVYLVITPSSTNDSINVLLDGKVISNDQAGADVKDGVIKLDNERLYKLVNLHGKGGNHILKLEFNSPHVAVYAYTFG